MNTVRTLTVESLIIDGDEVVVSALTRNRLVRHQDNPPTKLRFRLSTKSTPRIGETLTVTIAWKDSD